MPVRAPLEARLIADCIVQKGLPASGPLTFRDREEYVLALEDAISECRARMKELRRQEARRQVADAAPSLP